MGTWGYKLYDDDVAADTKDLFLTCLEKADYNCEKATEMLLKKYEEELKDEEDSPIIWFALADTQWEKGMLLEYVKETAIKYIDSGTSLERWEEDPKLYEQRKKVLDKLKAKLLSEQPPIKVRKKRTRKPYECPWKIGDTFALQMLSDEAKYNNFYGRYLILTKVCDVVVEDLSVDHTCPMFLIKITKGTNLPQTEAEINELDYMLTFRWTMSSGIINVYNMICITTSKRVIPKELIYLGNYQNIDKPADYGDGERYFECYWKFLETLMIYFYNRYTLNNMEYFWPTISKKLKSKDSKAL